LGDKGAIVFDGECEITIAASTTRAIDTTGAGDMFAGAFLYAVTHSYDYETAGRLGCLAASQVVSGFGPRLVPEQHQRIKERIIQ
jgi:sugar/nucleoside kinase (ribokinase family)